MIYFWTSWDTYSTWVILLRTHQIRHVTKQQNHVSFPAFMPYHPMTEQHFLTKLRESNLGTWWWHNLSTFQLAFSLQRTTTRIRLSCTFVNSEIMTVQVVSISQMELCPDIQMTAQPIREQVSGSSALPGLYPSQNWVQHKVKKRETVLGMERAAAPPISFFLCPF